MALLPSHYLDCVVAIGSLSEGRIKWGASGFLYGSFAQQLGERIQYNLYLVTNKHVLQDKQEITLRFNPTTSAPAKEYSISLFDATNNVLWFCSDDSDIDVAILPIDFAPLLKDGITVRYFLNDHSVASIQKMKELGVSEGDFTYVLGFPMGFVGEKRNAAIVRNGSIARISDLFSGVRHYFLLDSHVFPGNSGGPVVLRPEADFLSGTNGNDQAYLIGVVAKYLSAKYPQNQQDDTLHSFQENSGLSVVYPVDYIEQLVKIADARIIHKPHIP